jgi:hypothetical protein
MGKKAFGGKRFLDMGTLREMVRLRGSGTAAEEIERRLGLQKGIMQRIGPEGYVDAVR